MRLRNKTILITGATSGIGFASAQSAIQEGAFVVFTARHLKTIAETQALLGNRSLGICCDQAKLIDHEYLIDELNKNNLRLDGIFLNAANVHHEKFEHWKEDQFDLVFNTNVKGPFFLIQKLIPLLNKQSSIVLCGSTSIHIALEQSSVYAASKIALRSLVKTLSREHLSQQIRFNLLSPGPTKTAALDKITSTEETKKQLQTEILNLVPIQRMADPHEIADALIYLISDQSKFVLGTELLVDGGVANL